jgi:hypothetical protein
MTTKLRDEAMKRLLPALDEIADMLTEDGDDLNGEIVRAAINSLKSLEGENERLKGALKDQSPCVLGCEAVCGQPYAEPDERLRVSPCCIARQALSDPQS